MLSVWVAVVFVGHLGLGGSDPNGDFAIELLGQLIVPPLGQIWWCRQISRNADESPRENRVHPVVAQKSRLRGRSAHCVPPLPADRSRTDQGPYRCSRAMDGTLRPAAQNDIWHFASTNVVFDCHLAQVIELFARVRPFNRRTRAQHQCSERAASVQYVISVSRIQ